ncbi:uncharacterized protein [Branchiostoma lanceolatum]|uniref:uncharacterized protein isoform X1 n=2 Tax=Branchiostoma lanceolatum TaxID=7740 RepID=UPI003455FE56
MIMAEIQGTMHHRKQCQNSSNWSSQETHCLISLWNNDRILSKLEKARKKEAYDLLTRGLQEAGYCRTTRQVNIKVRNLRYLYLRHKEAVARNGKARSDWEFFEVLDAFLGDWHATRTGHLRETMTEEDGDADANGDVRDDEDADFISETTALPRGSTPSPADELYNEAPTTAVIGQMTYPLYATSHDVRRTWMDDSLAEVEDEPDEDEGDSDSSISGLSKEVTLAVLPRLQMEELLVELRRRNVDILAGSNNRKSLVKILHRMMVGEYAVEELKNLTMVTRNLSSDKRHSSLSNSSYTGSESHNVKETTSSKPTVWVVQPGTSGNRKLTVTKNDQSAIQGHERTAPSTHHNTSAPRRTLVESPSRNQPINAEKTKSTVTMVTETAVHPPRASDKLREIVDQVTRDLRGSGYSNLEGSGSNDLEGSQSNAAINLASSNAADASETPNPEGLNRLIKQEPHDEQTEMQEEGNREEEYTNNAQSSYYGDNMNWEDHEAMAEPLSEGENTVDGTATALKDIPSSSRGGSTAERRAGVLIAPQENPPKFVMTRAALKNPRLVLGVHATSKGKRTGTKRKCPYCPYKGDRKNLLAHVRIHTGEKPFKCSVCDYSACQKANLDRHMLKHTGEKPFMCGECGYRTAYKCHLMPHMLEHAGAKPFVCGECGYRSRRKSNLVWHQKTHQKTRPYKCKLCHYTARRSTDILRHMGYKHKDQRLDDHSQDHGSTGAVSDTTAVDHHSSVPPTNVQELPSSSSAQQVQDEAH